MKAYPRPYSTDGVDVFEAQSGADLRDVFAGQAMAALIASGFFDPSKRTMSAPNYEKLAAISYEIADALMVKREPPV